ncbi:MAG: diaminopimelate epimerase [Holosporales bacterium]|nr:diaminopimelate epimerase [Holosporales bacterium]
MKFYKAHGLGNDFVIIDLDEIGPEKYRRLIKAEEIAKIADRRKGIGCDQMVVFRRNDLCLQPAEVWFYNKDGSGAETCGNGLRCLALLLSQKTGEKIFSIATKVEGKSIRKYSVLVHENNRVTVNMGAPSFVCGEIPIQKKINPLDVAIEGIDLRGIAVNVGNPHVVFFADNLDAIDLAKTAPMIENHPYFPERINVSFARVNKNKFDEIYIKVWERGAGRTKSCGSAACAVVAAANKRFVIRGPVTVFQPGGSIVVDLDKNSGDIYQTAEAEIIFSGFYINAANK